VLLRVTGATGGISGSPDPGPARTLSAICPCTAEHSGLKATAREAGNIQLTGYFLRERPDCAFAALADSGRLNTDLALLSRS
jgi:hypothetical protein